MICFDPVCRLGMGSTEAYKTSCWLCGLNHFPLREANLCGSCTQTELYETLILFFSSNIPPPPSIHQVISLKPIRTWEEICNDICPVSVRFVHDSCVIFLTLFRTHLAICLGSQFAAARADSRYVLGWFKWNKCNFSRGKTIHLVLHCLVRNAIMSFTIHSSYQAWELCCVKNQIASPAFRSCWMMIPGLFPDNL